MAGEGDADANGGASGAEDGVLGGEAGGEDAGAKPQGGGLRMWRAARDRAAWKADVLHVRACCRLAPLLAGSSCCCNLSPTMKIAGPLQEGAELAASGDSASCSYNTHLLCPCCSLCCVLCRAGRSTLSGVRGHVS